MLKCMDLVTYDLMTCNMILLLIYYLVENVIFRHDCVYMYVRALIYRVIRNDCRGFNNLSYTIHLRQEDMFFFI